MTEYIDDFLCPFKSSKGQAACKAIPSVEYRKEWQKGTKYGDGITPTDPVFDDSSLVKFTDPMGHSTIAIQYTEYCSDQSLYKLIEFYLKPQKCAASVYEDYDVFGPYYGAVGHYACSQVSLQFQVPGVVSRDWVEDLITQGHQHISYYNYGLNRIVECDVILPKPLPGQAVTDAPNADL